MFDVFYKGAKPNLFPFELPADTLEEAASLSRTKFFWFINGQNDYTGFDFNFRAVPWEEYQIHTWPDQWQIDSGTYFANKYTIQDRTHNYHKEKSVHRLPNLNYWHIPNNIDPTSIDYRWCPNPNDPPLTYHMPSQHQSASGAFYRLPNAAGDKLIDPFIVTALLVKDNWDTVIPVVDFDYSWHPNVLDPAYNYVFGNQWNPATIEPTVVYRVPDAAEDKFMDEVAQVAIDMTYWEILDDIKNFDYSWRPNPTEPPYIYVFGNQWLTPEQRPAVRYVVPEAIQIKYMEEPKALRVGNPELFVTHYSCEYDYSWEPDPGSPPYNYIFGNQHWPAEIMPTIEYNMLGAVEPKYLDEPRAQLLPTTDNWQTLIACEFDYSWLPDPGDPVYIYVFGNQWYSSIESPTVEYHVPGATERKFLDEPRAKLLPIMERWTIPEEVNKTNIDFSWVPHPKDKPYIHHFGSEFQMSVGLLYTVPGATEPKFEGDIPLIKIEKKQLQVLDIFFIDKSNVSSAARYEKLVKQYPHAQRVRYVNSMIDTIKRCIARTKTGKFWVISSENIYDDFNFAWHAQPWQSYMTHVFGSQHQKWSDTYLINKWEFERTTAWANSLEEFPNLNFVQDQSIVIPDDLHDIYFVDHGNENDQLEQLQKKHPNIKTTRYVDNYLDTFKRIMSTATTEHVWIISSLCDYTRLDFSWQPEPWQKEMIHVFPSNNQERGDTFYIHVESFKLQMVELALLDWFNVINYCKEQRVPRLPIPSQQYTGDNLIEAIKSHEFKHPFTWFYNYDRGVQYNPSIWYAKDRKIVGFSAGNSYVLVPRDAKSVINTQAYDYPYITKMPMFDEHALDIIYISNGEPDAERWYEHLISTIDPTRRSVKRVQNVNGRANAYKAAAELSTTPWFFAVFAKLEVVVDFDWDWQPDYLQGPKHYIFHAKNPVNGLEYGHMGVIAYNKRLVLETNDSGLDFTLSKAHAVVPVLSAVAHYNTTPELTWRTAFRECIKLRDDVRKVAGVESDYRLDEWLHKAEGANAEWSIKGAEDAIMYYDEVDGDMDRLMLTFEWAWLKQYYATKYTL